MAKESSLPKTRCSIELRKKAEIRAKELLKTNVLSEYITYLVEKDTEHIKLQSKEEILMQVVLGQHPNPVEALVNLIKSGELDVKELQYKLTLPPKLKSAVIEKL